MQFRNQLVDLYDFGSEKELHHSAWYSQTSGFEGLKELLPYSEPYLVAEGKVHQEPPIKIDLDNAKILHVFYGDFDYLCSLKKACLGFGNALRTSKLLPQVEILKTVNQPDFDLISLMALIYRTADNSLSIIDSTQVEFQRHRNDICFDYWDSYLGADLLEPLGWFFGSTKMEKQASPPVVRIYTEQNLVRLAVEALDFQLFALPELSLHNTAPRRSPTRNKLSTIDRFKFRLLNYFLLNRDEVPKQNDAGFEYFMGKSQSTISKRITFIFGSAQEFKRMYSDGTIVEKLLPQKELAKLKGGSAVPSEKHQDKRLVEFLSGVFAEYDIPWEQKIESHYRDITEENAPDS